MVAPVCDKAIHYELLCLRLAGLDQLQKLAGIHTTFRVKWEGELYAELHPLPNLGDEAFFSLFQVCSA